MKSICYILILILFLAGCSKEFPDTLLIGKWEGISFTTSIPVDENLDGIKNTDLKKEMDCVSMKADFSSNGRFTIESTDVVYNISIFNGEVVLTPKGCGVQTEKGNWSLDESSTLLFLEFKTSGKEESTWIEVAIELLENRLVMKDLFYEEEGVEQVTYTIEFKRI